MIGHSKIRHFPKKIKEQKKSQYFTSPRLSRSYVPIIVIAFNFEQKLERNKRLLRAEYQHFFKSLHIPYIYREIRLQLQPIKRP